MAAIKTRPQAPPARRRGMQARVMRGSRRVFSVVVLAAALAATRALAQAQQPVLHTNQAYVEEVTRTSTLDVNDPMAVFAFVFANLPDRVTVYPTENYYYFTFVYDGVPYDGNIRLDASNRDQGKVNFAYTEDLEQWRGDIPDHYRLLDAAAGVELKKLADLTYRMTFHGKSVVFALNDLSGVRPPAGALAPGETFIGPVFDESGVRFFLVYNSTIKAFLFILDETVKVADGFEPTRRTDRIVIGKRTGFAFYRDQLRRRKILIGAYEGNVLTNTYFDGPFDQLPDNFIKGDALRDALIDMDPTLKGHIDRFGHFADGERVDVGAYLSYRSEADLAMFDRCATARRAKPSSYYQCFAVVTSRPNEVLLHAASPKSRRSRKSR
jgi:hypothetical protein